MNRNRSSLPFLLITILVLLTLLISGCDRPTDQPPVPTEAPVTAEPTQAETAVPVPPAAKMKLVDPAGGASPELIAYLSSFAAENSLLFETINSAELSPQTDETRVVILLAEPPGVAEFVSASPATQFIVIGNVNSEGLPNLSVISARGEDLAFMSGYLTQMIAWDWRSAGLIPNDVVMTAEKTNAFINGARYMCGVCTPFFAPVVSFPMLAQESMQADAATWGAQVAVLGQHFVNTYYVDPAAASVETLDGLMALEDAIFNDVHLIGLSGTPNHERFTALLGYDTLPALQQLLPQVVAGSRRSERQRAGEDPYQYG